MKVTENLTPEQVQNLMKALDEEPDQTLASPVRLALFTGMRRSALRKASGVASAPFGSIHPSSRG